jgi:hypothetical protein
MGDQHEQQHVSHKLCLILIEGADDDTISRLNVLRLKFVIGNLRCFQCANSDCNRDRSSMIAQKNAIGPLVSSTMAEMQQVVSLSKLDIKIIHHQSTWRINYLGSSTALHLLRFRGHICAYYETSSITLIKPTVKKAYSHAGRDNTCKITNSTIT